MNDQVSQEVNKLLIENPEMSATTFMNLLKSKGLVIAQAPEPEQTKDAPKAEEPKEEAEGSTGNVAVLRDQKESDFQTNNTIKFVEAIAPADGTIPTKFKVYLIQEGLGNLKDGFWYSKDALKGAVPIFEGKKIFVDHPSEMDEMNRPERTVRDIIGHYENVNYEEGEDGRGCLSADAILIHDEPFRWASSLFVHAVEFSSKYPDQDFVGLSINANGEAEVLPLEEFQKSYEVPASAQPKLDRAISEGLKEVRVVKSISSAISVDLVTEAGAGGTILQMLEKEKSMEKHEAKEMEKKEEAMHQADQEAPAAKHDDEAQDVELIKKMIAEYMGGEGKESGVKEEECHEAYEAAKGLGMKHAEAMEAMKKHIEMGKKIHEMKAKKEASEAPAEKDGEEEKKPEGEEAHEEKHHESAVVIKLKGENAALREKIKKYELEKFLDKTLENTKLPMRVTKDFRECLTELKSEKQVTESLKLFLEGAKSAGKGFALPLMFSAEKTVEQKSTKGFDLSDCVK